MTGEGQAAPMPSPCIEAMQPLSPCKATRLAQHARQAASPLPCQAPLGPQLPPQLLPHITRQLTHGSQEQQPPSSVMPLAHLASSASSSGPRMGARSGSDRMAA